MVRVNGSNPYVHGEYKLLSVHKEPLLRAALFFLPKPQTNKIKIQIKTSHDLRNYSCIEQRKNCIVVGDSVDDRCMVGHAGKGVAFCTNDELLERVASKSIKEKRFESLLAIA